MALSLWRFSWHVLGIWRSTYSRCKLENNKGALGSGKASQCPEEAEPSAVGKAEVILEVPLYFFPGTCVNTHTHYPPQRTREMAQWVKVPAAKTDDDPSSGLGTHNVGES